MEFRILNIFDTAFLFGVTYYSSPEKGYSSELNVFLIFLCLQWKWYE